MNDQPRDPGQTPSDSAEQKEQADEQARVMHALRESEQRLQRIFDGLPEGLVVACPKDRRFRLGNRAFADLLGCRVDEIPSLGLEDILRTPNLPEIVRQFERMTPGEMNVAHDIPVVRRDSSVLLCDIRSAPIDLSGELVVIGTFWSASDRRRLEDELLLKKYVFHCALTANSIADVHGVIIEANDAFLHAWGFESPDQVIGQTINEFLHFKDETDAILKALDATGEWQGEYTARRRDGSTFLARSLATVVRDENGQIVGYQSSVLDITKSRQDENEKKKLQAQLFQAQKMESIGQLAGGVAHDFNNMLGVILGYADLLLEQVGADDSGHASILGIRNAAKRSTELTQQLLAFARKQTVSPRVLDLNAAVTGSLKMLRRLIGENIDLDWIPEDGCWPVNIDPGQIDQILANLCVNARDAINGVGRIAIRTRNRQGEGSSDRPAELSPGDHVLLEVSDTGCGMDPDLLAHIFEPFFTTKGLGMGTGLGLSMLYGIVRQNGGVIDVRSEPGVGSTFSIWLPRHAGDPASEGKEVPPAAPQSAAATILVVEDEPMVLEMCRLMLDRLGYRVLVAATPADAIRLADERANEIDLLLTDVVMPKMNGLELSERLRARNPHFKILFMSGYVANALSSDGKLDPRLHFLAKPFSRQELARAVRKALTEDES